MPHENTPGSARSRFFFIGLLAAVWLIVIVLNRHSLFVHPSVEARNAIIRTATISPDTPAQDVTFAIFDTETTGVDPAIHRLVEIAVVKYRAGEATGEKSWLINPERFIPQEAQDVHQITPEMVADQPGFADIYPEFSAFIDGCVLIAHNARFDVTFLQHEIARADLQSSNHVVLDSLRIFRNWYPNLDSYSLEKVAEHLELSSEGTFHRAKDDSVYVARAIYEALDRRPGTTLGGLYEAAGGPMQL